MIITKTYLLPTTQFCGEHRKIVCNLYRSNRYAFRFNPAFAEGISVPADGTAGDAGWVVVGAGLAIGLAALGGALGQGNTAKAANGRNGS